MEITLKNRAKVFELAHLEGFYDAVMNFIDENGLALITYPEVYDFCVLEKGYALDESGDKFIIPDDEALALKEAILESFRNHGLYFQITAYGFSEKMKINELQKELLEKQKELEVIIAERERLLEEYCRW